MSRTLTQIALVGAAIAVNVYAPALGTFALGQLGTITAGLSPGLAAGLVNVAAALGPLIQTGVTVAGVQAGAKLAGLGPKLPKPETTETAIRTSTPVRVYAFGRRRLFGAQILFETAPDGTAADAFVFHDGRMDGVEQLYLNDDKVSLVGSAVQPLADGRYKDGAVNVFVNLGLPTETAFSAITALLPSIWTASHRGDGVVTAATTAKAVKDKDFIETYPNGVPTLSIAGRWLRVFDWRDPGQDIEDESTWEWSENAILHLAWFMANRERLNEADPLPIADWWAQRIAPQIASWTAAANVCDEPVPLAAGGTEARYRSCVTFKATDEHKAVKAELLTACGGWLATMPDGSFLVRAGQYEEPTVTLGPDEITGYSIADGQPSEQQVDSLIVTFVSEAHDYNVVDADAWVIREGTRTQSFAPQVPSHTQARRLAKRVAISALDADLLRGSCTTNWRGRIARGQRYVNLNIVDDDGATFFSGPAEITDLTRNFDTGGVTFDWIEARPDLDDWDPASEEGAAPAVAERVELVALEAPTIVTAEAIFDDESADGLTGARIAIIGTGPDREDLTWYTRWRVDADDPWVEETAEDTDPASPVALLTGFVPVGVADLEVNIAYEIGDGRRSPWSL